MAVHGVLNEKITILSLSMWAIYYYVPYVYDLETICVYDLWV